MGKVLKTAIKVLPGAIIAGIVAPGSGFAWKIFGATLAVGTASSLLAKQPEMDLAEHGTNLRLKTDPSAPRQLIYGRAATGGTLVFRETAGTDNNNLHMAIVLASHEIESVDGMVWAGEAVSFSGISATGMFASKMYLTAHLGLESQLADSDLVADCAKWTSAHKLQGVAYVHLKLIYDTEVYKQGLQQTRFFVKGRKIYDPRLDSTNGGTGSHRLADTTTWEWSDNPALIAADYLMGLSLNGKPVAGMGVNPARIDWGSFAAEANICDEPVTILSGGTEKRYTCNGIINTSRRHGDNLGQIASAMGGNIVFQSGKWRAFAAASRPAVLGRDSHDLVGGISMTAQKGWSEKVNAVRGVYPDVDVSYEAKDYPPLVNSTYVAQDGGQELWMDLSLPMTTSKTMAQRLAKIALNRSRMEKKATVTLTPTALQDQCMDAVNFTYLPFNVDGQKMLVTDWSLKFDADKDGNIGVLCQETLVEEDDSIYDWTAAIDEQTISTPTNVTSLNLNPWKGSDIKYDGGETFESLKPGESGATYGAKSGYNFYDSGNTLRFDADLLNNWQEWADVNGAGKPDDYATYGSSWGGNIIGQPSDSNLLNDQQAWADILGSGKPYDYADVTGNNSSYDTYRVNGVLAGTVEGNAAFGYQLGQSGSSYRLHEDSIFEMELGSGYIGGKTASLALTHATDIVGSEYDNFADTSQWTAGGEGTISVSGSALSLTHTANQTSGYTYWKEVAKGGVHEKIEFDTDSISSESGFLIGGTYVRSVSGTWNAPSSIDTGFGVATVAHHEFLLKPDNTFDWLVDDVLVASDIPFTAGGSIGLKNEGAINVSPIIRNWKHWNKPISSMFGDRVINGFDRDGRILLGNPHPNENMLDYDCKQEWSGTATTNHVYLWQGVGSTGDLDRLGLKGGDVVTFSCECYSSTGQRAGLHIYYYNAAGGYIGGASNYASNSSYARTWSTRTLPDDCASMKVWMREYDSGVGYVKNAMLIRGSAKTPFVDPPLRLNRDMAPDASYVMPPNTTVGERATFSLQPLSSLYNGPTSTISFAACNLFMGGLTLALASSSITGLTAGIIHYVYLKIPSLRSASYTFHASTNYNDISKGNDRVYVGPWTTASSGSSGGSGSGGGGVGTPT